MSVKVFQKVSARSQKIQFLPRYVQDFLWVMSTSKILAATAKNTIDGRQRRHTIESTVVFEAFVTTYYRLATRVSWGRLIVKLSTCRFIRIPIEQGASCLSFPSLLE